MYISRSKINPYYSLRQGLKNSDGKEHYSQSYWNECKVNKVPRGISLAKASILVPRNMKPARWVFLSSLRNKRAWVCQIKIVRTI